MCIREIKITLLDVAQCFYLVRMLTQAKKRESADVLFDKVDYVYVKRAHRRVLSRLSFSDRLFNGRPRRA